MPGDPVPRGGVRLVRVNVGQFIFRADDRVALTADWSIVSPHHHVVAHHRTQVSAPSGPSPTQQAAAMSNTLGLLADRIAQALSG
jgi:hypothetical protein